MELLVAGPVGEQAERVQQKLRDGQRLELAQELECCCKEEAQILC